MHRIFVCQNGDVKFNLLSCRHHNNYLKVLNANKIEEKILGVTEIASHSFVATTCISKFKSESNLNCMTIFVMHSRVCNVFSFIGLFVTIASKKIQHFMNKTTAISSSAMQME